LKGENRRLREDVEMLRGEDFFFAGELDPRSRKKEHFSGPKRL